MTVHNTTSDPVGNFLTAASPGGIEAQEAAGQQQLINSTALPAKYSGARSDWEELGFTFGDLVAGDPLFRHMEIPAGWTKQATDHAMHSQILDHRGIARVGIFYKAAFYDRRADMHLIHVGSDLGFRLIHGEDEITIPAGLNAEEIEDIRGWAQHYLDSHSPFGDHANDPKRARADAVLQAIEVIR